MILIPDKLTVDPLMKPAYDDGMTVKDPSLSFYSGVFVNMK